MVGGPKSIQAGIMTIRKIWVWVTATLLVVIMSLLVLAGSVYKVNEGEQVFLMQFGAPIGDSISTPGFRFKMPFFQKVHRFPNYTLEWKSKGMQCPTKDNISLQMEAFAKWRIADPLLFYRTILTQNNAEKRFELIIGEESCNRIANYNLSSLLSLEESDGTQESPYLLKVDITNDIRKQVGVILEKFGVEIIDYKIVVRGYLRSAT